MKSVEKLLKGEMSKLTQLLDEANCLQYTATTMIDHLQKNPEALAAVGLTLAEISQLARKVGPKALMSMKTAFPAVVALLASPEFLIAGGVAVGVTVVMLGGYKIIKRIKQKKEEEKTAKERERIEKRELKEKARAERAEKKFSYSAFSAILSALCVDLQIAGTGHEAAPK